MDDFMGRAFYLLGTIPSRGERKSLDLYSHSAKSKMGSVMVDLRIRGLREGQSSEAILAEHLRLTRAVIDHESKIVSLRTHTHTHFSHCPVTALQIGWGMQQHFRPTIYMYKGG